MVVLEGIEEIDHFKTRGLGKIVRTTEVNQHMIFEIRIRIEKFADLVNILLLQSDIHFSPKRRHL
jgi:hypothetical protein